MRSGHSGRISRRMSSALLRLDFPGTLSIPSGLSTTMMLSYAKYGKYLHKDEETLKSDAFEPIERVYDIIDNYVEGPKGHQKEKMAMIWQIIVKEWDILKPEAEEAATSMEAMKQLLEALSKAKSKMTSDPKTSKEGGTPIKISIPGSGSEDNESGEGKGNSANGSRESEETSSGSDSSKKSSSSEKEKGSEGTEKPSPEKNGSESSGEKGKTSEKKKPSPVKTKAKKKLAYASYYAIKGKKIYVNADRLKGDKVKTSKRVMKLNGKSKKKTKYKVKNVYKDTNVSGYYVTDDVDWDDYYDQPANYYLRTPSGYILLESLPFPII